MNYKNIDMNYKTLTFQSENLKEHFHVGYEIILVTQGESVFTINDQACHFEKYSIVFINNLERHKMQPLKLPYSRYMAIIDADFFDSIIQDPVLLSIFKVRPKGFKNGFKLKKEHVDSIEKIFYQLSVIYSKKQEFWQIEFNALLSKLIVMIYRNYREYFPIQSINKAEKRVFDIQGFIDENFKKEISLESLSAQFYLNRYYLAHIFKEVTGFTIKQYILLKKIAFAKNELYFTDKSITEIALDTGFNSQSNFIRIFQKKEGITPLQFRMNYRKNE
jgi:AraC-like DNA-binding protein